MRLPRAALALAAAVALTGCSNRCRYAPGESPEEACIGGCGCGGGCSCDSRGEPVCTSGAACRLTCLDDAGAHYPGDRWDRADESCTCDYSGNVRCCPLDAGSCTVACLDARGNHHQVGERWVGLDGGSCTCREGFVVDCGAAPAEVHCSFAGKAYHEGDSVDAGAACACTCGPEGHVLCPSPACLPQTCSYKGSSYQTGLIFPSDCNFCLCGDDGTTACTSRICSGGRCEYQGTVYDAGASLPSADGCNTCQYQATGAVTCTQQGCAAVHCVVDGGAVAVGTTFLTADRCDLCGCGSDGTVYCTARPCSP